MKKFIIKENKTGRQFSVSAVDESEARDKIKQYIIKENENDKLLQETVRNAVRQAISEETLNEGWFDAIAAFGQGVGKEVQRVGQNIKNSNPVQYAKQYSKEKDAQRAFDKTGKKIGKASEKIDRLVANEIVPLLQKSGVLNQGRYSQEGLTKQLSSFIKQFIQKQNPNQRPTTTSYADFKNPNQYQQNTPVTNVA